MTTTAPIVDSELDDMLVAYLIEVATADEGDED